MNNFLFGRYLEEIKPTKTDKSPAAQGSLFSILVMQQAWLVSSDYAMSLHLNR